MFFLINNALSIFFRTLEGIILLLLYMKRIIICMAF